MGASRPEEHRLLVESDEELDVQEYIRRRRERRESLRKARDRRGLRRFVTLVAALFVAGVGVWVAPAMLKVLPPLANGWRDSTGAISTISEAAAGLVPGFGAPVAVQLLPPRGEAVYGQPLEIRGRVLTRGAASRIVLEEKDAAGRWIIVARVSRAPSRRFVQNVTLTRTGVVRAVVAGNKPGRPLAVKLRPVLTSEAPRTAFWRRPFRLSGSINPATPNRRLCLQMLKAGGWFTFRETTTNASGGYEFRWSPQRAAEETYRVLAPPAGGSPGAASASRKIRAWLMVGLTFDDGPSQYTEQILDALRADGSKATFFMAGYMVGNHTELVRRVVREGHALGNHSWRHKTLTRLSEEALREDLSLTNLEIRKAGGRSPHWLRPPGGATSERVNEVSQQMGMKVAIWDVTAVDWFGNPSFSTIAKRVSNQVKPFDIVLMHDGGGDRSQTAAAMPFMLKRLRLLGYLPVTLDQIYPGTSAPKPVFPASASSPSTCKPA